MIQKIEGVLKTIEKRLIQVLFLAMTLVVLAAIFNRLTFNYQMAWSDEFSRYTFEWLVFIAAAYASGENAHIGVTALVDIFPKPARRVVELLTYVLCLGLSAVILYYTLIITKTQIAYGQLSPSMRLPMQYAYAGMAVGGLFMALHYVLHILDFFTKKTEEPEKGRE